MKNLTSYVGLSAILVGMAATPLYGQHVFFPQTFAGAKESAGVIGMEVHLDAPSAQDITVAVSFVDLEAVGGLVDAPCVDYLAPMTQVVFEAGVTNELLIFELVDDSLIEPTERFMAVLGDPTGGATLGVASQLVFAIYDDDADLDWTPVATNEVPPDVIVFTNVPPPVAPVALTSTPRIGFSGTAGSIPESGGGFRLTVGLWAPFTAAVSFAPTVLGQSPTPGADYIPPGGIHVITAGQTRVEIPVTIVYSNKEENDKTITFAITNIVNAQPRPPVRYTVTIVDEDRTAAYLDVTSASRSEANPTPVVVPVRLVRASERTNEVRFSLGGSAEPDGIDYVVDIPGIGGSSGVVAGPRSGTLIFLPGETEKIFTFTVVDDDLRESDENVVLTIAHPRGGVLAGADRFELTIVDDDAALPSLEFAADRSSGPEYASVTITVRLSARSAQDVLFELRFDGTATPGVDYLAPPLEQLIVPAGELEAEFDLVVIDDLDTEPDESVQLTLINVSNAMIGERASTVHWIIDDDRPEASGITLVRVEVPAAEVNRKLTLIGPKTASIVPRGLAVDDHGNVYFSDYGPSGAVEEGGVWWLPPGSIHPIRLVGGLTRPSDIELTPDQRSLVVALDNGTILRLGLGLTLEIENIRALSGNTRVFVHTPLGVSPAYVPAAENGLITIMDLWAGAGADESVDLVIEHRGESRIITGIPIGAGGSTRRLGHTKAVVEF